jgi:type I restriction enzyme S subunit
VSVEQLITEHLDIWTAADTEKKSGRGRSSGSAGSVYGIKKLRELILELAVRGKLVPQDESDEPASELLKRIAAEKAKLIAEGKIKKDKPLASISDDEKLFEIPSGWICTRFQNIFDVRDGTHDTPKYCDSGFPLVTSKNLYSGILDFSNIKYISEEDHLKIKARSSVERGDILFAMIGSIGNPVIVKTDNEFSIKNVALFKPYSYDLCDMYYLLKYLLKISIDIREQASGAVQSFVSLGAIRNYIFYMPPLEEQHQIVAKVDELMALCDQLENQHNNAAEAHEKLVTHLLGTLTQSQNAKDFNTQWQRISEHFDTLFTTETSIDALKQTLLQLAVMGKLVPQDPNDEPASELLKRIQAEKAKLIAEGKIKKDKPLAEITEEEKPFELPVGWAWVQWYDILANDDASFKRGPFGSSLTKSMFVKSGYKVYEQYCPINDDCSFERYYITPDKFEEMKGFAVKSGDYLVSCSRVTLGRITQIPTDFKEGIINQAILRVRINHRYYDKDFFKLLFRSQFFQKQIFDNSTGSAIPNVKGVKDLKVMPIPLFTVEEQSRIVTKVDELMTICNQLKVRITSSNQLQQKLADVMIEQSINVNNDA